MNIITYKNSYVQYKNILRKTAYCIKAEKKKHILHKSYPYDQRFEPNSTRKFTDWLLCLINMLRKVVMFITLIISY